MKSPRFPLVRRRYFGFCRVVKVTAVLLRYSKFTVNSIASLLVAWIRR